MDRKWSELEQAVNAGTKICYLSNAGQRLSPLSVLSSVKWEEHVPLSGSQFVVHGKHVGVPEHRKSPITCSITILLTSTGVPAFTSPLTLSEQNKNAYKLGMAVDLYNLVTLEAEAGGLS